MDERKEERAGGRTRWCSSLEVKLFPAAAEAFSNHVPSGTVWYKRHILDTEVVDGRQAIAGIDTTHA